MGHKLEQNKVVNSRTDFFYYTFRNILLFGIPLLIVSGLVLFHLSLHSSATNSSISSSDDLTISIYSACTLSNVINNEHNTVVNVGTYQEDIGKTTITTLCNDSNGYSVYANGFSNNELGNNKLVDPASPLNGIETGLSTNGPTSAWAMKLNNIENDPSSTPPVIEQSYNNVYGLVPNSWVRVASLPAVTTDMSQGSSFTTTYSVYASSSQYAGTYKGQVKYILTHPHSSNGAIIRNFETAFIMAGKNIAYQDDNGSYYAMQDIDGNICNSITYTGEITATQLVDTRDNKLYWVAKLADGHCWMTQNLDFDIVADEQDSTKMKVLTSEDTDLTDHSLTKAYSQANGYSYNSATGVTTWTPASSARTINSTGSTVTDWVNSNTVPYSASITNNAGTDHYSLGNYYNWTAAIASNNSSTLTNDTLNNIQNNPKNSVCPKGWRLPTISNQSETIVGSTNEFARLNYLYNNNSSSSYTGLGTSPLYFILNGSLYSNKVIPGTTMNYFSSTVYNNTKIYYLEFYNGVLNTSTQWTREFGRGIRCLAR